MRKVFFILILTCACIRLHAQVDIISTIANIDTIPGYGGDNGPAINAKLHWPVGICIGKDGDLYVADADNNRIRKIMIFTGIITTFAGKDSAGFSGDNDSAVSAKLNVPQDVCADSVGNIYIADGANNRIRKVTNATGIITTIAGNGTAGSGGDNGPATNSQLNVPSGLCIDRFGHIYVGDYVNNKIRKIDLNTGIITTLAGTGVSGYSGDNGQAINAKLNSPMHTTTDSNGNVFFSDVYNHVVRRVDISTGVITTVAGTGIAGYSGDSGLAKNAELHFPVGVYIDKSNSLYISEFGNGVIRRVDGSTGIITTVAGNGSWGFSGDGGPATNAQMVCEDMCFDPSGNMYVADYGNNCIRKVNNALSTSIVSLQEEIRIYPNPTRNEITVIASNNISSITICNLFGQVMYSQGCQSQQVQVNVSNLPIGIYLIRINDSIMRKFVKE